MSAIVFVTDPATGTTLAMDGRHIQLLIDSGEVFEDEAGGKHVFCKNGHLNEYPPPYDFCLCGFHFAAGERTRG